MFENKFRKEKKEREPDNFNYRVISKNVKLPG